MFQRIGSAAVFASICVTALSTASAHPSAVPHTHSPGESVEWGVEEMVVALVVIALAFIVARQTIQSAWHAQNI